MRKLWPIIIGSVLVILLTIGVGILSGPASNALPPVVIRYVWPLIGVLVLAWIAMAVWLLFLQNATTSPMSMPQSQNRQQMLAKVRAFWITGVLEQSLYGAVLIVLGLQEQRDAVENPWRLVLQQQDQPAQQLPPNTSITQMYDKTGGELLILGEPGSGKTTLLLELARNLLARADQNDTHPMPAVFNLSSWSVKRQSLAEWLIDELHDRYQVSHELGQLWVNTDQILPLLDGLDEVTLTSREACVSAINSYRGEHGLVPMVVCSRSKDYLDQRNRLLLRNAVIVQPFTQQQIDEYLSSVGEKLAAVRVSLRDDPALQEMVTTPLMLSVLVLAYQGEPAQDLLIGNSLEVRRRQVFARYVQSMLERRGVATRYKFQQTERWLGWLARQMTEHNQTFFTTALMELIWRPDRRLRPLHNRIALVINLLLWCPVYLVLFGQLYGPLIALLFWLLVILLNVVSHVFGRLINQLRSKDTEIRDSPYRGQDWPWGDGSIWRLAVESLLWGLGTGLCIGLGIVIVSSHLQVVGSWLHVGLDSGLRLGLGIGLFIAMGIWVGRDGNTYINQLIWRFLIWRAGSMPWDYSRFLDFAAERILLHKMGGSYVFIHRLLQEYFASLDTTTTSHRSIE